LTAPEIRRTNRGYVEVIMAKQGTPHRFRLSLIFILGLLALAVSGCSVRKLAMNSVAGALTGGGGNGPSIFASDDDPDLVSDALPFALKTFEALLKEIPDNTDLLFTTCQGFTVYAFAKVELEAERLLGSQELGSYRAAKSHQARAFKLYIRGREYCFRALDILYPGLRETLLRNPEEALVAVQVKDIPLLYWTAGSWGSAMSLALDRPEMVVDLPVVRALLERCLELDPNFDRGALQEAMIGIEALPESMGGSVERAGQFYARALELSRGRRAGTYVSWAKSISVQQQNRQEFVELLEKAIALDPEQVAANDRLSHALKQRYARILLDRIDEFFLDGGEDWEEESWEEEALEETSPQDDMQPNEGDVP
jgi:tetratricopeptide (TPR) repeat protein